MSNSGYKWDDAAVARLTELWNTTSMTAREIAVLLGLGSKRSAVIGKAHRLNLKPRAPGKLNGLPSPKKAPPKPKTRNERPHYGPHEKPAGRSSKRGVSIIEVTGCRYPTGYDGGHRFCNQPTPAERSYCPEHLRVVTRPFR
jgi:hypothetical protein